MALKIGTRVNDKYEILKVIDSGGMSTVYIAMDLRLNKNWALKEIIKDQTKMKTIEYKSLISEINILKELDHIYLPRIVDVIEDESRILVVMDYIEGKTLLDVISTEENGLPLDKAVKWSTQLATVLGYLHGRKNPIIYCDMKPDNIMLQPNGNIKLFDFGASIVVKEGQNTRVTQLGTKGYAAPERFGSNPKFGVRSDIYELGMTMYHMLTGHNPSKSPDKVKRRITEWNPQLNKGVEKIVSKMTAENPEDRYESTAELLFDLNNYNMLDTDYRQKLVNKLKATVIAGVSTLCLFTFSGVSYYANAISVSNQYNQALKQAVSTNNPTLAAETAHIQTKRLDAYNVLINLYKQDGVFSDVEEVQFTSTINPNLTDLRSVKGYGDLALSISELYFYYGKTIDKNHTNALMWLDEAQKYGVKDIRTLNNFKHLIQSYIDINNGNRSGVALASYFNSLRSELELRDSDDLINVMNVNTAYSLLENNGIELKSNGVSKDAVNSVLQNGHMILTNAVVINAEKGVRDSLLRSESELRVKANGLFQ